MDVWHFCVMDGFRMRGVRIFSLHICRYDTYANPVLADSEKEVYFMGKTKNTYKKILGAVQLCILVCLVFMVMPTEAQAKEKTAVSPGIACKSGRYIYFICNTNKKHGSGIMRYDTKKKKKKLLVDDWIDGRLGGGFYNLTVKGKYIYITWNRGIRHYTNASYVYRISKNGKKKKKLAVGRSPVVAGKYVYYIEGKLAAGGNTMDTGNVCRMKLNGKGKKKVIKKKGEGYFRKLYSYGKTILYSCYDSQDSLFTKKGKEKAIAGLLICDNEVYRDKTYEYYSNKAEEEPGNTIYRKNLRDNRVEILAKFANNRITDFRVCGKYVIIQTQEKRRRAVYCLDTASGKRKRLVRWLPS